MIGVGEAMGLVANALEQSQGAGINRQLQRQRPAGPINLFMLFGQADNREIVQAEPLQLATRGRKLALSTIDNDQVGQADRHKLCCSGRRLGGIVVIIQAAEDGGLYNVADSSRDRFVRILLRKFRRIRIRFARFEQHARISSPHDFGHAGEIILSFNRSHSISPVTILVRHAVAETNHRGHYMRGGNVGDVETFHHDRRARQLKRVSQRSHLRHRIDCTR